MICLLSAYSIGIKAVCQYEGDFIYRFMMLSINNTNKMELMSCSLCGLQYQQQMTVLFDIPAYQPQTDSVKIINRRTCKQCCLILSNIQSFVQQNHLRFCNHNFKTHLFDYYFVDHPPQPRKSIQLLYETLSQNYQRRGSLTESLNMQAKRLSMTERNHSEDSADEQIHPYIPLLVEEILQKNYLTLAHFPKTLHMLIHLSCMPSKESKSPQLFVLAEQRHEKVKNIALYLSEQIHLSVAELPYVLFLINFLLCFMNPQKTVSIIIQLNNILLACPQLLSWKSLLFDNQRAAHQTPLSPATIDLRTLLVQVDKLWAKIESVVDLSRRGENVLREGLIRISKLDVNWEWKDYKKKMSESLKSLLGRKEELDLLDDHHLQMLYLIKLERNGFSVILKQAMEEQEANRQEMLKMSHKFKMEKDQFIEKIVKLNNKIEALQQTIKELEQKANQNNQHEKIPQTIIKQVEQYTIQQPKEEQVSQNQSLDIQLNSIVTITDLFNFNQKYYHLKKPHEEPPPTSLTHRIILEVQKMEELIEKHASKVKSIEDEKTRLLGIISRKEERLLSVILEKDTIIERYEQALWTMENGLEVTEGPLVNRIKYIMHIFGKQRQSVEEVMDVMQEVAVKKAKEKDKDCEIY